MSSKTSNQGVKIRDNFVSFAELRADVQAAYRKGYSGTWAFTPETVEALLVYIAEQSHSNTTTSWNAD